MKLFMHSLNSSKFLSPFQVSRLVIHYEDAEDGAAMPDLSKPVQVVSKAVANLIRVRNCP